MSAEVSGSESNLRQLKKHSQWHIQYQYGFASDADFVPSLVFLLDRSEERSYLNSISIGKQFSNSFFGYKADVTGYVGVQYYSEKGIQDDILGTTVFWKVSRNFRVPFASFSVRLGLGQGFSYVSEIPAAEDRDFAPKASARWLYFIDYTAHLSVGELVGRVGTPLSRTIDDIYIGYSIFHRSSVFGQFAEARGGINFPGIGIEVVFR